MDTSISPLLLALQGPSGSGKTTLAVDLVRRWTRFGLGVGFAKHASHGFQMDREGKDTERVARSGGAGVAVTGPSGTGYVDGVAERAPRELAEHLFPTCQVLLLEGFREHTEACVVLAGEGNTTEFLDLARGEVLALVAAEDGAAAEAARARDIVRFAVGDLDGLARHLEKALQLPIVS